MGTVSIDNVTVSPLDAAADAAREAGASVAPSVSIFEEASTLTQVPIPARMALMHERRRFHVALPCEAAKRSGVLVSRIITAPCKHKRQAEAGFGDPLGF